MLIMFDIVVFIRVLPSLRGAYRKLLFVTHCHTVVRHEFRRASRTVTGTLVPLTLQ
jgi:hypothetical protein